MKKIVFMLLHLLVSPKYGAGQPPNVKWIDSDAFSYCALDSIVFPATVEYLQGGAFDDLASLQKIYSLSAHLLFVQNTHWVSIQEMDHSLDLPPPVIYLPMFLIGSGEKYRKAFGWSYFTNIIETDRFPMGIEVPRVDGAHQYKVYGGDVDL